MKLLLILNVLFFSLLNAQSEISLCKEFINKSSLIQCYKEAANKGNQKAQFSLAQAYALGLNNKVEEKKAFYWYVQASYLNNNKAMYLVAAMYETGFGVNKNIKEAISWYKKSSKS